jgi:hypothetical protein
VTVKAPVAIISPLAALSQLKVSPNSLIAANSGASLTAAKRKTGATISYVDSQAATTAFTVLKPQRGVRKGARCVKPPRRPAKRKPKSCTRWVAAGGFAHSDVVGVNKAHFTGRVKNRKLAPGRYRLRAVATFAGRAGVPVTTTFRVVKPKR